jgi:MFS family permease
MSRRPSGLGRVYGFGAAWMGVVVMPVYVPFLTERGLTIGDVLSLQAVYGVAVMLFEIPTGYICDVVGRRRTILIGTLLNLLGLIAFAAVQGFAAYAAVELLLAAGWSLVSGADIALIYDVLDETDAPRDARRRALANYVLAQVLGEAAAALFGGALAGWSLPAVGWATAAEAALPLLIALGLPDRGRGAIAPVKLMEVPRAVRGVFGDRTRRLVFANMIVWSLSTFLAVWLLQPYWQEQGIGLRWFGVLWAGTLVTVGVVGRAAPLVTRAIGQRGAMLVLSLAPIAAYAGMAGLGGTMGIGCGFLFYVSRGLNSVNLREAFNHGVPSRMRATFNSLASGSFRLSFALCGPVVGAVMDRAGLNAALTMLASAFLVGFAALAVPLMRRLPGRGG